jgi:alpha-L-rhamnosidase
MSTTHSTGGVADVAIVDFRCQLSSGVLAIGSEPIRLSWRVHASNRGLIQLAYEIETASSATFDVVLAESGVVPSADQVAVQCPGNPLRSREIRYIRTRILTRAGWTSWSPVLRVEAGLLVAADWVAEAITLPDDAGSERQSPSPVLRRAFHLSTETVSARLYVTALGVHQMRINGRSVSDDLLAPGWTAYRHRLLADAYDVTSLLEVGENVISGVLGDGWYRGRLGWDGENDRCHYGTEIGLVAQLEVDLADGTRQQVVTDTSWRAATAEIRSADLYDGAVVDLRHSRPGWDLPGYDDVDWATVAVVPFDRTRIEARIAPPVRVIEKLPVVRTTDPNGSILLDAGQNVAGYVRLRVRGQRGDRVIVKHAEVLEADGSLHTRSLRSAKATDEYFLDGADEVVLEPVFTFHGFRYAQVATVAEIIDAEVAAISSDLAQRSSFESSSTQLNRLHENVVWSQRDNFVSVPTDCPQRDERLGWGGDAQAFASTASTLFDAGSFWASWLRDLDLDQDDRLGVSTLVPDVVLRGEPRYGRAGWADAATIVPWAVYESYGDAQIIRSQFASMERWISSLRDRQGAEGLLGESMQFGDWLDPDAPPDRPWEAKTDSTYLANAFFAHSAALAADAASLLDDPRSAGEYRALADSVAAATWARWEPHALTTQTGCAVALRFGIAPESMRASVGDALARLVREANGRVATGFLGTPLVLPALSDTGHVDEAFLMLLRREMPSWLYQVIQGATTVWERWDAIRPDGSIHPGTMTPFQDQPASNDGPHMLSFNHYAYGAVIDWVYRHVAGIAPDMDQAGYRRVILAPKPAIGVDWARAAIETPYGQTAIEWRVDPSGDLSVGVELPFGSTGLFVAPMAQHSEVSVNGVGDGPTVVLPPGRHRLVVTRPRIAGVAEVADAGARD